MGNCGTKSVETLEGSIFDRVTSRTSKQDDCLLYRLANYQKTGDLIEYFRNEGTEETENLIRNQIPILLYNEGKGKRITRADLLQWKYRSVAHITLPMKDCAPSWSDHEACWKMEHRGSLGESLIHVLLICDSRTHTKLAKLLIKCFPKLALDVVEGEEFKGTSPLHLAIAYNNYDMIKILIDAGADINQRATGTFFQPADQQTVPPARKTDYEGLAYFGELPLSWATCVANETAYNMLIEKGADPNARDTYGNMVLHMVVICDKLEMYGYAMRHPKRAAKPALTNRRGLSPLAIACEMARAQIFLEMMELSALEFWRYSNITCSAYPLNALDTIQPDGQTNWSSALMIILNGTKEEHVDMLDGGIIQRLLEEKWKTFAQNQFMKRLVIHFIHLVFLSVAVYMRPNKHGKVYRPWDEMDTMDCIRVGCEIGVVLSSLLYLVFQLGTEIVNQGLASFLRGMSQSPPKVIFFISNLLLLSVIPCRFMGLRSTEDGILVLTVPMVWFYLMFFAGAIKLTGPFVTMIYSMITGDMLTFAIIFVVILFGFSQAFFFLHKPHPHAESLFFNSYANTWMALFMMTLGDYNYSAFSETTEPAMTKTIFAVFMVLVPILLLNMLIASMGNTYSSVSERSEKEWVKQWAKIVIALELSLKAEAAKAHLLTYSIKLPNFPGGDSDGDGPPQVVCGVMVIKSKSKTRANQRKGALNNWKRVGRVTINELRRLEITGEELRKNMWEIKSSTATPLLLSPFPANKQTAIPKPDAIGDALAQLAWQRCVSPVDSLNLSIGALEAGAASLDPTLRDSLSSSTPGAPQIQYQNQTPATETRIDMDNFPSENPPEDLCSELVTRKVSKLGKLATWNGNEEQVQKFQKLPSIGAVSDETTKKSPLILIDTTRKDNPKEEGDWDENCLGIKYGGLGLIHMPVSTPVKRRARSGIRRQATAAPPLVESEVDSEPLQDDASSVTSEYRLFDEPHIDSSIDFEVTDILLTALREMENLGEEGNQDDKDDAKEMEKEKVIPEIQNGGGTMNGSAVKDPEFQVNDTQRPKTSFPFRNGRVAPAEEEVQIQRRVSSSRLRKEDRPQTIEKTETFLDGFWTKPDTDNKCKVARGMFRQNGIATIARILDWSIDEEI